MFRITPDGSITQILDAGGDGIHALEKPWGIAVTPDGIVYVTGNESHNVFKVMQSPAVLPAAGNGGLAAGGTSSAPAWVWAAVAAMAVMLPAGGFRLWRRRHC